MQSHPIALVFCCASVAAATNVVVMGVVVAQGSDSSSFLAQMKCIGVVGVGMGLVDVFAPLVAGVAGVQLRHS